MSAIETLKERAAHAALEHIKSGMRVGLGSGSTAKYAIQGLGHRLETGELMNVTGVPTSQESARLAERFSIPLTELDAEGVEVAIDGMDEVTPSLDAIKGLGGALTREKIVAVRARTFILVGDERKRVARLGERSPVPVEVVPFGWRAALADLTGLGCEVVPRRDGEEGSLLFVSDNGNYLLDCHVTRGFDPHAFARELCRIPGVVEHGLFFGVAALAYVATEEGVLELTPERV